MNVLGKRLTVLAATDPTLALRTGTVVMETLSTILLDTGERRLRIAKEGSTFQLGPGGMVLTGSDLRGRLQDRLGRRSR